MKKILVLIIPLFLISSCGKLDKKTYVTLSGSLKNSIADTLQILNSKQVVLKNINLDNQSLFSDTLKVPEGYYSIKYDKEQAQIFLKPGFDLSISFTPNDLGESPKFDGQGADENNYLVAKTALNKSIHETVQYDYLSLSEEDYLKSLDSIYNEKLDLLAKYSDKLDEDFVFYEQKGLEFEKGTDLAKFPMMKSYITGDNTFKVSENYPDPYEGINLADPDLLTIPTYSFFIRNYLAEKTNEVIGNNREKDYYMSYIDVIENEVPSPPIKQELAYYIGKRNLIYTKSLDSLYHKIEPLITKQEYASEIKKAYQQLKKIDKGQVSPDFELVNTKNELVSLKDHKGKLVYIDVWATWCAPCIKEFPALEGLISEFKDKDISFISICMEDTTERWKKMIVSKNLKGIQLFAEDRNVSFLKHYMVEGIPRFMLIDKDGKIIDSKAMRPSNPKLKEQIEVLL